MQEGTVLESLRPPFIEKVLRSLGGDTSVRDSSMSLEAWLGSEEIGEECDRAYQELLEQKENFSSAQMQSKSSRFAEIRCNQIDFEIEILGGIRPLIAMYQVGNHGNLASDLQAFRSYLFELEIDSMVRDFVASFHRDPSNGAVLRPDPDDMDNLQKCLDNINFYVDLLSLVYIHADELERLAADELVTDEFDPLQYPNVISLDIMRELLRGRGLERDFHPDGPEPPSA